MSTAALVREHLLAAPAHSFLSVRDLVAQHRSRTAVTGALRQAVAAGEVVAVHRGLYWKGHPTRCGMTRPDTFTIGVEAARRVGFTTGAHPIIASPDGQYLVLLRTGIDVANRITVCGGADGDAVGYTAVSDEGIAYADLSGGVGGVGSIDLAADGALTRLPDVDALPLAVTSDGHGVFTFAQGDFVAVVVLPPAK